MRPVRLGELKSSATEACFACGLATHTAVEADLVSSWTSPFPVHEGCLSAASIMLGVMDDDEVFHRLAENHRRFWRLDP